MKALAPNGLDAVLALAGGDGLERCLDFVRPTGRFADPNGVEPEPRRHPTLRFLAYDAEYGPTEFAALGRAAVEARIQLPLLAVFSLDQAAAAHARVDQTRLVGRIAVRMREEGANG